MTASVACGIQVSGLSQMLLGQEDVISVELYVKEGSMPPMVLAIATPATHKELLRNHKGLKHFRLTRTITGQLVHDA